MKTKKKHRIIFFKGGPIKPLRKVIAEMNRQRKPSRRELMRRASQIPIGGTSLWDLVKRPIKYV
jgi:hypothetical protein